MDILELIETGDINNAYKSFIAKEGVENNSKEFNNDRKVRDTQVGNRKDKVTKDEVVLTTKIPIPFQRKIVRSAASFLFGSNVKLVAPADAEEEAYNALIDIWNETRIDALLMKFCEAVKSETEATIIFFPVFKEGQAPKVKARLLTHKNGVVYPIFDNFGDLTAFGWEYEGLEDGKKISYLYVWTEEQVLAYKGAPGKWELQEGYPKPNLLEKIPVVYLSQDNPEWWEVQALIDRFENSFSKFADTNDYFASPTYKVKGAVSSAPKKDDTGRIVKLDVIETTRGNIIEADLDVISWDRAPESLKLEFDTTKDLINDLSSTVDFAKLIGGGLGNISGIGLKLMFFSSILKAKWDEGDYRTAIGRIISLLKSSISKVTNTGLAAKLEELSIDVHFTSVLPENIKETIEVLTEATGGRPVMSQKTAVSHNPLVDNNQEEIEAMEEEAKALSLESLGATVN